jgi:phosphate transport system substrate-binding protein
VIAAVLVVSMAAAACGSSKKTTSPATTVAATATTTAGGAVTTVATTVAATTVAPAADLKATLNSSGATFPKAFYDEAIAAFGEKNKGVTINYGGGGSGKGRQDLADQLVDWAGSDSPIADADKAKFKGGDVLYFPTVVAPITVSYNLDGVDKLQLSPDTIAKIFQLQVKTWDAPEIAADNAGVKLPSTPIVVAVRSDSSGTTDNFTKFLNASAGAAGTWTLKSGSKVEWPAGVQAAEGNGGVAKLVKDNKGAIGYVDLSDAKAAGLKFALVKNAAGKFIAADLAGASAAAEGADVKADLTYFAGWAKGDAAYPIAAQTWVIVYKKQTDKAKGAAVKAFINYVLTDGQKLAPTINFGPLPKALADKAIAQLASIELPA